MILAVLGIGVLGLTIGSFLSAYTDRASSGISVIWGRSFCPSCKKEIAWFDNIPIFSFFILGGKCRSCGKKISARYPLIEIGTAVIFVSAFLFLKTAFKESPAFFWKEALGSLALPFILAIFSLGVSVFVIDLEKKIIPDAISFWGLAMTWGFLLLSNSDKFFVHLASGFLAASFLLAVNLITSGKGMGLGDVKLSLFIGTFMGWPQAVFWLFFAFLTGAVVGTILILAGKASFGKQIPFGPYLILSLVVVTFLGSLIFV